MTISHKGGSLYPLPSMHFKYAPKIVSKIPVKLLPQYYVAIFPAERIDTLQTLATMDDADH